MQWAWIALLMAGVLGGATMAAGATPVEELTKRLPDGVVAFVGTSGGDALKGDFEKTSLGRIWNDPGVRSFCEAIKTQVLAKAQEKRTGPNEVKQMDMIAGMAELVAGRPLIAGVAPLKGPVQIQEKPPVYGFLILDAGNQKAQFEDLVKKLEALAGAESIADVEIGGAKMRGPKGKQDLPLYWGWLGNYLVVAANDAEGAVLQYVQKPRAAVPAYFQKVPAGGDAWWSTPTSRRPSAWPAPRPASKTRKWPTPSRWCSRNWVWPACGHLRYGQDLPVPMSSSGLSWKCRARGRVCWRPSSR
jgi:hypothetical protein